MSTHHETEAGVIAALATEAAGKVVTDEATGRRWLIHPTDSAAKEVTDPHDLVVAPPARIVQSVIIQTRQSLVDYVNQFKGDTTAIFADIDASTVAAVIDYHGPEKAAHASHRATLQLQKSIEWQEWTAISGKLMPQREFARFLEENAADIAEPSGAELLEVARDMQAVRSADFRRVVRTSGDDESFEYQENTEARTKAGAVQVPTKFRLSIPVYFGEPEINIHAFLRWKLDEGQLSLGIALHRAEHVRQAVFKEILRETGEATALTPYFGKPGLGR